MGGMNNGVVDTVARAAAATGIADAGTAQGTANNALAGSFYGTVAADVTGSRAINTVYTNTTGRALVVNITAYLISAAYVIQMEINGVPVHSGGMTGGANGAGTFIVPNGATYKLLPSVDTLTRWAETRI